MSKAIRYSSIGETLEVPVINQLMSIPLENPDILSLAAGFTDNTALPTKLVHQIVEALPQTNPNNEYLQYGTTQGRPKLRELTCEYLNALPMESNGAFHPEQTMICNGSQQALFLATQSLCDPGDYVLVESPTYFVYLSMLQGMQVKPIGIPVDKNGRIDALALKQLFDELKAKKELHKIKLAYIQGYHANPSSSCLEKWEKTTLAATLRAFDLIVPVIEDAAYRDLAFEAMNPTPSVMSLAEFSEFPRLYLGTYTKPLATGLKIGYGCCSSAEWTEKMLCAKGNQDFGTANFSQAIVEQVLLQGAYQSLIRSLGEHYGKKAELLQWTLAEYKLSSNGWHWQKPTGGLLMWLRAPKSVDTSMDQTFSEDCKKQGVIYVPGSFSFANGQPKNYLRLSLGALSDKKLVEATRRFCTVASNITIN